MSCLRRGGGVGLRETVEEVKGVENYGVGEGGAEE